MVFSYPKMYSDHLLGTVQLAFHPVLLLTFTFEQIWKLKFAFEKCEF